MRKAAGPSFLFLTLALSACEGRTNPFIGIITDTTGSNIGGGNNPPAVASVLIVDNEFQPTLSIIRSGGVVVWVWAQGASQHNVTFDDAARSSPTQSQGTHSVTFPDTGTFNYHCTIHITMTGSVVVR
jgi:plastocyanin